MRYRAILSLVFVLALIGSSMPLFAQAIPPAATPAQKPAPPGLPGMGAPPRAEEPSHAAEVAADAAVITLQGFCQDANAKPCETRITRAEFEKLMQALDPNMQPQARQGLADQYTKVLIMSADARKHDIQSDPRSLEVMRFVQMQVLANLYNQYLQDKTKEIPAAEFQKYYDAHKSDYDEATVRRVFIPKAVPADAKKLTDAEFAALAADIARRAKAGEDFNALQKEAFDKMGMKNSPPPTDMGAQRRNNYSAEQTAIVFALEAGQVSDVVNDTVGAFIYKVVSRRTLSVEEAHSDIQANLQRQRYTDALSGIFEPVNVALNPLYFGQYATVSLPGKTPEVKPPAPQPRTLPAPRPAAPAAKPPGN